VYHHPWGAALHLPGLQRFRGLRPFTPTSQAPDSAAANLQQQQQQQPDVPPVLPPWLQQVLNNGTLHDVLQQQQDSCDAAADETLAALAAGPARDATGVAAAAADEAPTLPMLQQQVRKQWVVSRLLQAQGKLQQADAAGKACLYALQELGQLSGAAAVGTAALEGSVGTLQHVRAGVDQPHQQQGQQQQQGSDVSTQQVPCALVLLLNCVLDCTIDAAAVRQKLDEMWLSMQLLSAEQQLQGIGRMARQVQQLSASALQQQQQPGAGAGAEGEQLAVVLQLVGDVHCGADSISKMLGPRCLTNEGMPHVISTTQPRGMSKPAAMRD
jgi:hypothetical protein